MAEENKILMVLIKLMGDTDADNGELKFDGTINKEKYHVEIKVTKYGE